MKHTLQEENKRLREALSFYADEHNYVVWNAFRVIRKDMKRDNGEKARSALKFVAQEGDSREDGS